MNNSERKVIKGALQVRAQVDTQRGQSGSFVPAGSIGYVIGGGRHTKCSGYIVFWPSIAKGHPSDNRTSVHLETDLQATGQRG